MGINRVLQVFLLDGKTSIGEIVENKIPLEIEEKVEKIFSAGIYLLVFTTKRILILLKKEENEEFYEIVWSKKLEELKRQFVMLKREGCIKYNQETSTITVLNGARDYISFNVPDLFSVPVVDTA